MMPCTCRMETGGEFDEQLFIQCEYCQDLDEREKQNPPQEEEVSA